TPGERQRLHQWDGSKQLTREQMKYATTDAYMPLHLGAKMGLVDLGVSGRGVTHQRLREESMIISRTGLEEGEQAAAAAPASSHDAEVASGVARTGVGKPSLYEDFTDEISSDFGDIDSSQGQRKAKPCHWFSKVTVKQWLCAGLVLLLALLLICYMLWRYVVSRSAISSAINDIRWTLIEMKTDGKPFQCGPEAETICLKVDFEILAVNPSATWMAIEPSPTDLYYKDTYLAQIRTPAFTLPDGSQETVRFTTNLGGLNNETYKHLYEDVLERQEKPSPSSSSSSSSASAPITLSAAATTGIRAIWSSTFTMSMQYTLHVQNVTRVSIWDPRAVSPFVPLRPGFTLEPASPGPTTTPAATSTTTSLRTTPAAQSTTTTPGS
ncbi:hypothetical protein FOZ63_014334, partial [Perkinsus olseni]